VETSETERWQNGKM